MCKQSSAKTLSNILFFLLVSPLVGAGFSPATKETVVFFGDSITVSGQYTVYVESFLRASFPETQWRFINSGKASETLSGLSESDHPGRRRNAMERFAQEVALYSPTLVIACFGINDGIYHPFKKGRFQKYQEGIRTLIQRTQSETRAQLILCTPPTFDPTTVSLTEDDRPEETYGYKQPYAGYDQVMARYATWLMSVQEPRVLIADVHTRMRNHLDTRRKEDPTFRMQGDGIHPNETGHFVIAATILRTLGLLGRMDEAEIRDGKVLKGEIEILSKGTNLLHFKWKPLTPMPYDEKWDRKSLLLENFESDFNKCSLKITGLKQGNYQLHPSLRPYNSSELARGINPRESKTFPHNTKAEQLIPAINNLRKKGFRHYFARAGELPSTVQEDEKKINQLTRRDWIEMKCIPISN